MSLKSLIQIIIVLIVIVILGSVYFKYFSINKVAIEELSETSPEKEKPILEKKELTKKNTTEKNKDDEKVELTNTENNESQIKQEPLEEKELTTKNTTEKNKDDEKVELANTENNESEIKQNIVEKKIKEKILEKKKIKKIKPKNLVKDVEYLTTDKNGNKYKFLATSGKTNLKNNDILDLVNVRGTITSEDRSTIYIVSDFAEYNSSNLDSKFYQNVVINYEDKQITCENFDIDMETNTAIAYNDVIVTDPKSEMKAGIITLDIETKDINILPENLLPDIIDESKVKVITE